jgi:ABC-type branched-subunit amino acid transport system substrate-binding protein
MPVDQTPVRLDSWRRGILSVLVGVAAAGSLLASTPAPITIGLLGPPEEWALSSLRQGASLGVEQANQRLDARASLIIRGRSGQWGDDGVEAARMATDDGALALIAPPGGAPSHLTLQVAGRTAVPVVSLCGDASVTGAGIPWMVRIVPRHVDEAGAILSQFPPTAAGGASRWGAFVPAGRAGREAARDLAVAAAASHCALRPVIEVSARSDDLAGLVQRMIAELPDGILVWLDPVAAGKLVKAIRAARFAATLAGPGWLRAEGFVRAAGKAAEGFVTSDVVRDQASQAELVRFRTAYRQRFGGEPDPMAAYAYDAALLVVDLLSRGTADLPSRGFPLQRAVPGATGQMRFDRDGNRLVALSLLTCHEGQFVALPGSTCSTMPPRGPTTSAGRSD